MKTIAICALALSLSAVSASAGGVSISVDSDNTRTEMGPRHAQKDARVAITTRDGSTTMMLVGSVIAVQLSEKALADVKTDKDAGFLEELFAAGVRLAVGKSIEYPVAHLGKVDFRDGAMVLTDDTGKRIFTEIQVNGADVLKSFAPADAKRFVAAVRAAK